jgi:hypothetical protein
MKGKEEHYTQQLSADRLQRAHCRIRLDPLGAAKQRQPELGRGGSATIDNDQTYEHLVVLETQGRSPRRRAQEGCNRDRGRDHETSGGQALSSSAPVVGVVGPLHGDLQSQIGHGHENLQKG